MPDEATLSLTSIATLAFSTGLITALANQGISYFKERHFDNKKSDDKARAIAISVAANLTEFAVDCANLNALHQSSKNNGECGSDRLPTLRELDEKLEWTHFPPEFTARFHDLKSSLKQGQENVEFTEFEDDPPAAAEYAARMSVELGHQAYVLARRIRRRYGMGRHRHIGGPDPLKGLTMAYRIQNGRFRRVWLVLRNNRVARRITSLKRRYRRWRLTM